MNSFVNASELTVDQLAEEHLRDREIEAAGRISGLLIRTGRDHADDEEHGGVTYQRCGGGRRVIRKKIGGA